MTSTTKKPYDPLEGVTAATRKDELMERLRRAAAMLRREDNQKKKRLAEVEDRLRAKYSGQFDSSLLLQTIISANEDEWKEGIEFLEEFEDLLPTLLHRMLIGGKILIGVIPVEPEAGDGV